MRPTGAHTWKARRCRTRKSLTSLPGSPRTGLKRRDGLIPHRMREKGNEHARCDGTRVRGATVHCESAMVRCDGSMVRRTVARSDRTLALSRLRSLALLPTGVKRVRRNEDQPTRPVYE